MLTRSDRWAGIKLIVCLGALAACAFPAFAAAGEPLRSEMKHASENLRDYLAEKHITEIAIGDVINADPTFPSTAGPGIRRLLYEELERAQIKVKIKAAVGLTVAYRGRKIPLENDRRAEKLVVELRFTATFTNDSSQEDALTYRVNDDEAIRVILGLTADTRKPEPGTAGDKPNAREQQILLAFTKPELNRDGAIILAGDQSPFGLEILVDDKSVAPEDEGGLALVSLKRDQTYAIRVINRSPLEMAVRLCVDGINVFSFSELRHEEGPEKGSPRFDLLLVPAKETVTIPGWHRTNAISERFKITEYAKTAAARMNKTSDVGTITATFSAAWEKNPPDDEPAGARDVPSAGTGFGEPTTVNYKPVKRTIGAVRGSIAVRYKVPPASD